MKRRAVFFDRDNTLIANDGYLGDPARVVLVDGAAEAVARVRSMGYVTVVVSNQSGVARGLFGEDAVRAVDARMDALLLEQNPLAVVDRHEYCPFHPDAVVEAYRRDSPLRKPGPGMLRAAADAMTLDLSASWMIGDAPRDVAAGRAAGCRTILFSDPALLASPAAGSDGATAPDYTASTLSEAVDVIEHHPERRADRVDRPVPVESPRYGQVRPAPAVVTKATTLAAALALPNGAASPPPAAGQPLPQPPTRPVAKPATTPATTPPPATHKLESIAEQILIELRRRSDAAADDFSVAKLLAGITQIAVMAVLLMGYLQGRDNVACLQIYMLLALTLQAMTISLLIMSRQR